MAVSRVRDVAWSLIELQIQWQQLCNAMSQYRDNVGD